jgi:hypothetical protein
MPSEKLKDQTASAGSVKKSTKAEKLSKTARDSLCALADLASNGNEDAAAELHGAVTLATHWLSWLAQKKPDIFSPIAATKFLWPVLYGVSARF